MTENMVECTAGPLEVRVMGDPCPRCGGTDYYCAEEADRHIEHLQAEFDGAHAGRGLLHREVDRLREIATIAADTVQTVMDYQGSATTQQAMNDAMWRLWRTLQRHGYNPRPNHDLNWRGSLLAALERAGLGMGEDGEIRIRTEQDKPWQHAAGELVTATEIARLTERLEGFREMCQKQTPFDADACVRCSQYHICLTEYEAAFARL